MGDLSKNFSRHEHECNCGCGFDAVDVELNKVLQDVRNNFGIAVDICGPNRCVEWNRRTAGAAPGSLHTFGKAADIKVSGTAPIIVYDYLNESHPDKYEIGLYWNRVHIGICKRKKRW